MGRFFAYISTFLGKTTFEVFFMTVEIIIKEVRENKGISLKELEEDTGIDRRRLAKIENGEVPVDKILFIEMLVIAQNLGTKITDLYRTGEIVVVGKDRF